LLIVWPAVGAGQLKIAVRADGTLDHSSSALRMIPDKRYTIRFTQAGNAEQLLLDKLKSRAHAALQGIRSNTNLKKAFDLDTTVFTGVTEQLSKASGLGDMLSVDGRSYYQLASVRDPLMALLRLETVSGQIGYGLADPADRDTKSFTGSEFAFTTRYGLGNQTRLTFLTKDLHREFDRTYYNALLNVDATVANYSQKAIEDDYAEVERLNETYLFLSDYVKVDRTDNFDWYCRDEFVELFELVTNRHNSLVTDNRFFQPVMRDWVLQLLWLTDGRPQLNPFGFTDEDKLPLLEAEPGGFDQQRAAVFDQFVEEQIALTMKRSFSTIEEGAKALDKLLKIRGSGKERYQHRSSKNETLRAANGKRRTEALTTTIRHSVNLRQAKRSLDLPPLIIDASNGIHFTHPVARRPLAVPNSGTLYATAINIPINHKIVLHPESKDIVDRSAVVSSLGQAAGGIGVAFTGAGRLTPIATLINAHREETSRPAARVPLNYSGSAAYISKKFGEVEGLADVDDYYFDALFALEAIAVGELQARCSGATLPMPLIDLIKEEAERFAGGIVDTDRQRTLANVNAASTRNTWIAKVLQRIDELGDDLVDGYNSQHERVAALAALFDTPSTRILPPGALTEKATLTDTLTSQTYPLPTPEKAARHEVLFTEVDGKGKPLDSLRLSYKTAPAHRVSVSLGLSYQIDHTFERITATTGDAGISTEVDDDRLRTTLGLHLHLAPMLNVNNAFFNPIRMKGRDWLSRISIMAGVSWPEPLENYHLGAAIDLLPGLKVIGGQHFFRRVDYTVVNGTIAEEDPKIAAAGPYLGITVDPTVVTRFFGLTN
jgi:hypothetical protein